jgi:gamma-glutamylcyclotransferase (GGCT)/AIG2-like uncharacterized protein YtfP
VTAAVSEVRLFVYGTLMRGQAAAHLLQDARFVGEACALGFALVDTGAYPAMIPDAVGTVSGEVWAVDAARLPSLDYYEGHPALFERSTVVLGDGTQALAYVYRRDASRFPRIEGGAWRGRGG